MKVHVIIDKLSKQIMDYYSIYGDELTLAVFSERWQAENFLKYFVMKERGLTENDFEIREMEIN